MEFIGIGKPDGSAPLPLLLFVSRQPEEHDLVTVLKCIDIIASKIGVYRCDLDSPKWDPERSLKGATGDPSTITPDDLLGLARRIWGPHCADEAKVAVIEFVPGVSWLIAITKPNIAAGADHAGYMAELFPRRAKFFFNPTGNLGYVSTCQIKELESGILLFLKKYRYDLPKVYAYTDGYFNFGIEVRSGSELNLVFSDLDTLIKSFNNVGLRRALPYMWGVCEHGRYFQSDWSFELNGKKQETACIDCINGATGAKNFVESTSEAPRPGEEYYRRSIEFARHGDWKHATEELRAATNLGHQEAWSTVTMLWCPRCRMRVSQPSTSAMSDYAMFWRGVCPQCETQLRFRIQ